MQKTNMLKKCNSSTLFKSDINHLEGVFPLRQILIKGYKII